MRISELPPIPVQPGVYLWKGNGEVLYVGKAKNLRSRVTSYFHAEGKSARVSRESLALEFIVTRNEVEALLLEANLIKTHMPRYNVLLKDDKHYPFLKLTSETYPMLMIARRVRDDGAHYWGPFPDAGAVRRIKRMIERTFPIRKNSGYPMKSRQRPCLNYAMGRCLAPCVQLADLKVYTEMVRQVTQLLNGRIDDLISELSGKMQQAAEETNFEYAAELRDQIRALEQFFSIQQQAYNLKLGDLDFLGLSRAGSYAEVQLYQMRSGRIIGRNSRFVEGVEEASDEELLDAFLRSYYLEASPLPRLILLPREVDDAQALAAYLLTRSGYKVTIHTPKRGEKLKLVEFANRNANAGLETEMRLLERRGDHPALKALAELLKLTHRPFRIEGYDISNLMGEAVVASITAFEGGRPKRSDYRRIRIKGLTGSPDDYASMEEAVFRRFSGSLADHLAMPDLLLIDGGIGQVRAAEKGLARTGLRLSLVGLAKRSETLIQLNGQAISLPLTHPALQLLIYLRDETHKNGLHYNRKLRRRKTLKSIFDQVPGIGPSRKRVLLEHFSTLEELAQIPLEELAGLQGMTKKSAQAVLEMLNARQR